jgi:hypothetical protein
MTALPLSTTDDEIFALLDVWMELLRAKRYEEAFTYVDYYPGSGWTPDNIRAAVKGLGGKQRTQRLIIRGPSSDSPQERRLFRWKGHRDGYIGTVVYPLRLDGAAFKLNATFLLRSSEEGITLHLNDIFEVSA